MHDDVINGYRLVTTFSTAGGASASGRSRSAKASHTF